MRLPENDLPSRAQSSSVELAGSRSCFLLLLPLFSIACSAGGDSSNAPPLPSQAATEEDNSPNVNTGADQTAGTVSGATTGDRPGQTVSVDDEDPLILVPCDLGNCPGSTAEVPPGCGDGALTEDEACDDGNLASGDGCDASCLATEPGFSCAQPGQPCQAIARCGDALVATSEQCDDGNTTTGDGCSERCRIERGKKCEGEPSVCTDATCGDGVKEGAEACDDGNSTPFDGCSSVCETEPNCQGTSCTSDCGDGLAINEACDDGNRLDGDGCSSDCNVEQGFSCTQETRACEQIGGQCVLRVPVLYRDFSDAHPDFGGHQCNELVVGAVASALGDDGLPRLSGTDVSETACLSSDVNLAQWYSTTEHSVTLVSELVLFDNQAGGYVNRWGAEGERFEAVDPASEKNGGATLDACEETCASHARNGEKPMFDAALRCDDVCRPSRQEASDIVSGELSQLNGDLNRASDAVPRDDEAIAEIEAQIAAAEERIAELEAATAVCDTDCAAELAVRVTLCTASCKPCSNDADSFCIGGESVAFDGTPLFFPVDSLSSETADNKPALIPAQYGYSNWPWENEVFPDAPNHNFFFTSEVRHWFQYDAKTKASLDFLGDDDVWVFINGQLAVDLGGIHAPASGTVSIDATSGQVNSSVSDGLAAGLEATTNASTADFGLVEGNVYEITVFHAERQLDGSSFKLTLAGFEATPSECSAVCGDGVLSFGEECDDGSNDGGYGQCDAGCVLGAFCGDSTVQAEFGEDCDVGPAGSANCRGCRVLSPRVR